MPISIKLVRGAYYADEIKHAEEHGLENPIHDTLEKTHSCYDACASKIISDLKPNDKIVIATHNENSIMKILERYDGKDNQEILKNKNLYFGQLLGLGDHLSRLI